MWGFYIRFLSFLLRRLGNYDADSLSDEKYTILGHSVCHNIGSVTCAVVLVCPCTSHKMSAPLSVLPQCECFLSLPMRSTK